MKIILGLTTALLFLFGGEISVSPFHGIDVSMPVADAGPPKIRKQNNNNKKPAIRAKKPPRFKKSLANRKGKPTSLLRGKQSLANINYKPKPGAWKGTASVRQLLQRARFKSGITVLGTYKSGYLNMASQKGANRLNMPNSVYNKNQKTGQSWTKTEGKQKYRLTEANRKFLDRVAKRGDKILLSVNGRTGKHSDTLRSELYYMQKVKGYRMSPGGFRLYPPKK